jgi:hypothetical protein
LQAQYKITPLSAWGKPYAPKAPAVDPNPGISRAPPRACCAKAVTLSNHRRREIEAIYVP